MPPRRMPPELTSALAPFLEGLKGLVKDVVVRSAEAALDTALEETEARVEGVAKRISGARQKLKKPKRRAGDDAEVVAVQVEPSKKRRRD